MSQPADQQDTHPCKLKIDIPFPTVRLAAIALRALAVDKELSSLVTRAFSLAHHHQHHEADGAAGSSAEGDRVLVVHYAASTDRMLRVAVNGFFESLGVVLHCMQELDVDVVGGEVKGGLEGVQGLEQTVT